MPSPPPPPTPHQKAGSIYFIEKGAFQTLKWELYRPSCYSTSTDPGIILQCMHMHVNALRATDKFP